ncbi:Veg family protein [Alkaliphilus sp. B6464]|uniref:Veg family protein n=1 Tax=Alkaliphilus sp. B6464 TaxID=2731219 RepID=UPI001BA68D92|nr:Veg family protein [Alkaliphilus sp. B6464]QUH19675.1 Veg family protein [Alkaliphilus sp. B6464]
MAIKTPLDGRNQLQEIRKNIEGYVGQKIVLKANKGRKKTTVREGILENTYPNIFIVRIDGKFDDNVRRVSYSYSDILTETVEITVCSDNKSIKVS